jgi:hypothetical protein
MIMKLQKYQELKFFKIYMDYKIVIILEQLD